MFDLLDYSEPTETSDSLDEVVDWGLHALRVEEAWRKTRGEGVKVAILDTGWTEHPDVAPNVVLRMGFVPNDETGGRDTMGHGTHVAGIVGAVDNGVGVVGVAPGCALCLAKVVPGDLDSVLAGLHWAQLCGADVVNLSFGVYEEAPELHAKVRELYAEGIVIVAAAGNRADQVAVPARYPEVIAVGALDRALHRAGFSPWPDIENFLALPGVDIFSTWLDGCYARITGTSMAAPMVTGLVALALSYHRARVRAHQIVAEELAQLTSRALGVQYRGRDANGGVF